MIQKRKEHLALTFMFSDDFVCRIRVSGKIKNMGRIGFGSTEFGKNKQTKMHEKIINKFTDKNVKLKVDLKL